MTLTAALDRAGRSQRDLAYALGISEARVSEMVHGRRRLQTREYKRSAELLALTDGELLAMVTAQTITTKRRRPAERATQRAA